MTALASPNAFDDLVFAAGSPFARLTALINDVEPGGDPIDLSVGGPRHAMPDFVGPTLVAAVDDFRRYPPIRGTGAFQKAVARWLEKRYALAGLIDPERMVLALNGSREGLFFAALAASRYLGDKMRPAILLPNPFYQAYMAGAVMAGVEPVMMPSDPDTGAIDFAALDGETLSRTVAVYVASPANPQGGTLSKEDWSRLIALARDYCFLVLADECYSEIYRGPAPTGVLEAAAASGRVDLVVAFNSLSKRSNLAGLRCGFAAGDPDFLDFLVRLRNMAAPQVPIPVQSVAIAAYGDEAHVAKNRSLYDAKFAIAEEIFGPGYGYHAPAGGFFLWLDVSAHGGGEAVTRRLWTEAGIRAVPGGYLASPDAAGVNPGEPYIRLALVDDVAITREALQRFASVLSRTGS